MQNFAFRFVCKQNKIELIVVEKDVMTYAKKMKVSVEEAGRENQIQ